MTPFPDTKLKRAPTFSIYHRIYEHLRSSILAGQLKRGAKLPSTRALADELGVSRNTILNAYGQLAAEGYLERVKRKGTFVTQYLPEDSIAPSRSVSRIERVSRPQRLSKRATSVLSAPTMRGSTYPPTRERIAFPVGIPALDAFPFDLWAKLMSRHAHGLHPGALNYPDLAGYRPLREAIANHVIVARHVHCSPEQVIITIGTQGALHLAAQVLLNPGDRVWVEDPGYPIAHGGFLAAGAQVVPVPVDAEGIRVEAGIARAAEARMAYVTPSHQFPLGMTMSLTRRCAILDWAKRTGAYIMEDDYDGEYRFDGRPLTALQGLDEHNSVIYVGTFSKVLFPALRLGYLIVPDALVAAFLAMRRSIDVGLPRLEQMVLADFIAEGHFTRHIRRMRTLYAERRTALLEAARDLPLELDVPHTGLHLIGWLPDGVGDRAVALRAAEQGVDVVPLSVLATEALPRGGLALGYGALNQQQIEEGVRRLRLALLALDQ
jgi:GntR family transcriptional regulator/MocR family aminotransferase